MKIEDIKDLLEEIEPDQDGSGYIDCGTGTEFMDCSRYRRILAAVKQCLELHSENADLTRKLEEVENQKMELSAQNEKIKNHLEKVTAISSNLVVGIQEHLTDVYAGKENEIRIGDYIFIVKKDHTDFHYEPLEEFEPIELKIKITENSDKNIKCPICDGPLGKYPAISREDNKTKICSNCGTLEALAAFKESLKDNKENE